MLFSMYLCVKQPLSTQVAETHKYFLRSRLNTGKKFSSFHIPSFSTCFIQSLSPHFLKNITTNHTLPIWQK